MIHMDDGEGYPLCGYDDENLTRTWKDVSCSDCLSILAQVRQSQDEINRGNIFWDEDEVE